MDFILSLTHFCEVHGPKSVLCTQVLPIQCALCLPPSPTLRATSSTESLDTQVHESVRSSQSFEPPGLQKTDTGLTLPSDFSGASTTVESEPPSPKLERHPLFKDSSHTREFGSGFRYGRAQGDTCASCSFTVPGKVADQLPQGAPGSPRSDGKGKNGAPVLRSRHTVCVGNRSHAELREQTHLAEYGSSQSSHSSSSTRSTRSSHSDCHDHTVTYLTSKSPDDPENYSLLRASVIRTLSCELLPRGMSDGPICFGDTNSGYTIAYVFRLTDPKARGRRRAYALVALAGKDTSRAFRAAPMLWEAFAAMAQGIEEAAQRCQDEEKKKEDMEKDTKTGNYTPVSSFLTQRSIDPDGHPRRAGQISPRSLAEIVGDENIFAYLHQYFVVILRSLGQRFGGLPLAERPSVYPGPGHVEIAHRPTSAARDQKQMFAELEKACDPDKTPTIRPKDEMEMAKSMINRAVKRNSQCAPLVVNLTAHRQVEV